MRRPEIRGVCVLGSFLAEPFDSQIPTAEQPGSIRVIARAATNIAAFVGRALKGPVNEPVPVRSFADYTRVFGGLWQPSTLSYAVEQFFENGGRCAVIVRVVNGARPPTLTLPTGNGKLILRGVGAGSREFLRASVDYDAIDAEGARIASTWSCSACAPPAPSRSKSRKSSAGCPITPGADRFVADALLDSRLVRVQGSVPTERPTRTPPAATGAVIGYTPSNPDGDDGGPITDYDVIGSAQSRHRHLRAARRSRHQPAVHSAADARSRRRPVDAAGRRALLPRTARHAHRRSAVVTGLERGRARRHAPLAVPQRRRGHVLSAHRGLRPAARPLRDCSRPAAWPPA